MSAGNTLSSLYGTCSQSYSVCHGLKIGTAAAVSRHGFQNVILFRLGIGFQISVDSYHLSAVAEITESAAVSIQDLGYGIVFLGLFYPFKGKYFGAFHAEHGDHAGRNRKIVPEYGAPSAAAGIAAFVYGIITEFLPEDIGKLSSRICIKLYMPVVQCEID